MRLDLGQVEAFATAAAHLHFGRAASEIYLTQQALSKRIARLEQVLGEPLFIRQHTTVELTAFGHGFLPHARRLLEVAREVEQAADRVRLRPLRVDVWGQVHAPMRIMTERLADHPMASRVEPSMRRSGPAALTALASGEIDAAFCRPYDFDVPPGLSRRPFHLDPLVAAVPAGHEFAGRPALAPADLRRSGVWWPMANSSPELVGWVRRYGAEHDIPLDLGGANLGREHFMAELGLDARVTLVGADWSLPPEVVKVAIWPIPHYLWWLLWRTGDEHPLLQTLHTAVHHRAGWLPAPDLADESAFATSR